MQEARNSMANFPQEGGSKDLKLLSLFSKHGIDMHINQVIFRKILSTGSSRHEIRKTLMTSQLPRFCFFFAAGS